MTSQALQGYAQGRHFDARRKWTPRDPSNMFQQKNFWVSTIARSTWVTSGLSNSFYFRTTSRWNKLPADVVTAQTLNSFKNRFDKYIEREQNELTYITIETNDDE